MFSAFFFVCLAQTEADVINLAEDLESIVLTEVYKDNRIVPAYFPVGIDASSLKMFKVENTLIWTGLFSFVASETEIRILQERIEQKLKDKTTAFQLKAQTFSYRIEYKGRELASRPLAGGSWREMPLNLVLKDIDDENELILDVFIKFEWQDQTSHSSSSHKTWNFSETPEKVEENGSSKILIHSTSGLRTVETKRTLHLKINQTR